MPGRLDERIPLDPGETVSSGATRRWRLLVQRLESMFTRIAGIGKSALDVLFVDTVNKRVGIVTNTPTNRLTIQSSGTSTSPLGVRGSSGSALFQVAEGASGDGRIDLFDASAAQNVQLHSNGPSYLRGGNIGLGNDLTETYTDEETVDTLVRIGNEVLASQQIASLQIRGYSAAANQVVAIIEFADERVSGEIAAKIEARRGASLSTGTLGFYVRESAGTFNEKLTIKDNGNVGINEASPSYALEVDGKAVHKGKHVISKASDETVNNSSSYQDDDDIVFPMGANETWIFRLMVMFNSGAVPDLKLRWDLPLGATINWALGDSRLAAGRPLETGEIVANGSAADYFVFLRGAIFNSTLAGNAQLEWAQNTADASDTTLLAGTNIVAEVVP